MAKRGGGSGKRYVRDNRGRFATTGATARGGRLKTAGGKKRATQTVKAKTGGKPAGTLKAKPRSEGQKYAKRVQAGKDLKRSQSTAREKKFFAETQQRLDAAPLAQSRAALNKISKSPRQLNRDEKIARDVMTDKRFRSDRQRVTEMLNRGIKPGTDVVGLVANVRSKQGGSTTGRIKPATGGKKSRAKAAAAKRKSAPKDGTDITREIGRAKGNKRIKNLNQQIKEAGTNAAGLRLEKLKVQTRMPNKPRQRVQPTAKQSAKEASRNDAIRKRSAELRAQSGRLQRNQANIQRLKNQSPKPGSRRLSPSQISRTLRADTAKDIYSAPSTKRRAQIVRNQAGIARTERAKNNSMRLRSDRLAEAKATGLSMIKVTRPKRRRS